jgi:hypothetical protein
VKRAVDQGKGEDGEARAEIRGHRAQRTGGNPLEDRRIGRQHAVLLGQRLAHLALRDQTTLHQQRADTTSGAGL